MSRLDDLARHLDALGPEAEACIVAFLPPFVQAARRLRRRDAAVRTALALLLARGEPSPTAAATRLECELRRYLAGADWRIGREPGEEAGPVRIALHRLAVANAGEGLGWRTALRAWARE